MWHIYVLLTPILYQATSVKFHFKYKEHKKSVWVEESDSPIETLACGNAKGERERIDGGSAIAMGRETLNLKLFV
jgi:hypothetical protein